MFVQHDVAKHCALQAARLATYGLPEPYATNVPAPVKEVEEPFPPQIAPVGVGDASPETVWQAAVVVVVMEVDIGDVEAVPDVEVAGQVKQLTS
jgi:hypothetical protein